jgi:hypothetical protein
MTEPTVYGQYEYEKGDLRITVDSGQHIHLQGESADRFAERIQAEAGVGGFSMSEESWGDTARGSFR